MKGDFPEIVPYGYCYCGCGEQTGIISSTWKAGGDVKGEPRKFLPGHNAGMRKGKNGANWKGGRKVVKRGNTRYVHIYIPEHQRSNKGYVLEHILVAEEMNGGPLSIGAVVHHIDGNGENNNEDNLMIFSSNGEHLRFHAKERRGGK